MPSEKQNRKGLMNQISTLIADHLASNAGEAVKDVNTKGSLKEGRTIDTKQIFERQTKLSLNQQLAKKMAEDNNKKFFKK